MNNRPESPFTGPFVWDDKFTGFNPAGSEEMLELAGPGDPELTTTQRNTVKNKYGPRHYLEKAGPRKPNKKLQAYILRKSAGAHTKCGLGQCSSLPPPPVENPQQCGRPKKRVMFAIPERQVRIFGQSVSDSDVEKDVPSLRRKTRIVYENVSDDDFPEDYGRPPV